MGRTIPRPLILRVSGPKITNGRIGNANLPGDSSPMKYVNHRVAIAKRGAIPIRNVF